MIETIVRWKHLKHPNIVPFLGVTKSPIHLVSAWTPGVQLNTYITRHPDANRLELVRISLLSSRTLLTPFQVNWHCKRAFFPPFQ